MGSVTTPVVLCTLPAIRFLRFAAVLDTTNDSGLEREEASVKQRPLFPGPRRL